MLNYSDLVKRQRINEDGVKVPMEVVLGKDIIVTGFDMRPSNMHKKDYLCLKFEMDGEKHVVFTDSEVLRRECERFKDDMPFGAKIVKKGRYFTFD
ncbi:MAG: hypothetical protein LUC83_02575 [Clostridiales bacterium]|nr:hypothetical protein [Clostridiales bacterium]